MTEQRQPFLPDLCQVTVALGVILVTELVVIVYILSLGSFYAFDWQRFALLSLYVQWIVLLSIVCLCQLRSYLNRRSFAVAAIQSFAIILAVTMISNSGAQWVYFSADWQRWDGRWLLRDVCIAAVLAGIGMRYMTVYQSWQNQRRALVEARVDALNARIRPHFLFNSMNTIASLIAIAPDTAERAVEDLSALFRASIAQSDGLMPFAKERELCDAYLRIEQHRLGGRLQIHWDLDELPDHFYLPLLTLQPLIENAIHHGIETCPDGGCVSIVALRQRQSVSLRVSNPLSQAASVDVVAYEKPSVAGNGVALDNIADRLQAIYSDGYGKSAALHTSSDNNSFVATLELPVIDRPNSV